MKRVALSYERRRLSAATRSIFDFCNSIGTFPTSRNQPAHRERDRVDDLIGIKGFSGVRRWTVDDIAKLKNMAQKHPSAEIASQLGRSTGATIAQAHKMKLSLRIIRRPKDEESSLSGADAGPRRV